MLSKEQLSSIKFTNLVQHTHWTIPMGIGNVKKQIQGTIKKGLNGFVVTDHNVMSGVLEAYFLGKDKDFLEKMKVDKLPVVIGARLSFTDDLENKDLSRLFSLTLYAKSMTGYKNLIYLNSISSDENHYFQSNRLSIGELIERSDDLMVGSGGINGLLGQAITKQTGQEEDLAQIFKDNFGDNFFIEIHFHPVRQHWDAGLKKYTTEQEDLQRTVNLRLIEIAKKLNIRCCLVQNSYMIEEKHFLLQNILIQNHPDYKKSGWMMDQAYPVMSVEDMYNYIQKNSNYISDAEFIDYCANTQYVLDQCKNIRLEFSPALPAIKYDEHVVNLDKSFETKLADLRAKMVGFCDLMVYLIDQSEKDISLRTTIKTIIRLNKIDWKNKTYVDRLAFELKVMQLNGVIGLCDYFLLLEDVTNYVVSVGKLRGFGRGSGGGSLLTYGMDISDVDPVKYGLLFERFLTKERIGTYFFEINGYDFKNKDAQEDLTNPYYHKIVAMLDKSRVKESNKEYLEKELTYLEFNPNVAEYVYKAAEQINAKGEKIENKNNSTVSYCINITDQKATEFIKSTPTTLPDFDYDTDGRDEVKEFLTNKYGKNHVTLMGTIGTLKTKGALKDIIRQLRPLKDSNGVILKKEVSFDEVNELTKKFNLLKPTDFKTEIEFYDASIEADAGLRKWIDDNKDIDDALRMLLGNAKSTGIHAGGIVVSSRNVLEVMPMTWSFDEKMWVTQSEMGFVERSGLIKYDFLGLKTLGDLNRVLRLVNARHGTSWTLSNVPMDEKAILELFVKGATESVFQFNTSLATSILIQLKEVRSVLDLAMITSIARPGPLQMEMDKTFILRNTEQEKTEYMHPSLIPILKDTYGILCIAKGSQVLTKNGQKNIEDVSVGELVLTEDGTYQKVLANWFKGQKKTVRVRASNGEEIVCTADHKVLTDKGWKEAGKLTPKDLIKSFWIGEEKTEIGTDADWLVGLSIANGDLTGSQVNISCSSKSFSEKVKGIAEASFGLKHVRTGLHERCWKTYLGQTLPGGGKGSKFEDRINPFMTKIKELNLKGMDCYNKRLPKSYNLAMLAGFIEGDGSLLNYTVRLKNKELAYDIYLGLQAYRIPSSFFLDKDETYNVSFNDHERKLPFKIKTFKDGNSTPHVFIPRSYLPKLNKKDHGNQSQLTFPGAMNKPLKLSTLKSLGFELKEDQHSHWSKVLSVKEDIVRDVYDLSIENVHSFVVGGHVLHNCYQEQIIQIAKAVGDFDNDSSVSIMKALSKKQLDKVVKYKEKFVKNAQKHGYTQAKAETLWQLMESFASYGFNLSHAAAYGCVSYLCMWFKSHYPAEWYSAVLSGADKDDFKILYPKWKDYIKKPNINRSKDAFTIDDENMVVMPLNAINGVGTKAVENIIKNQPYSSFSDFFNKIDKRQVNKATVVSLIFSGVFDEMRPADCSENKWRKMLIIEFLKLKYLVKKPSKAEKETDDAFIKEVANMNRGNMLMKEISLLNFTAFNYFEYYKDKMTDGARQKFGYEAITPGMVAEYPDNSTVVIGGSVEEITIAPVKNPKSKIFGQEMVRMKISNAGESIEVVLFPKQLAEDDKAGGMIRALQEYTPIVIKGRVSRFGGGLSLTYEAGWNLV